MNVDFLMPTLTGDSWRFSTTSFEPAVLQCRKKTTVALNGFYSIMPFLWPVCVANPSPSSGVGSFNGASVDMKGKCS